MDAKIILAEHARVSEGKLDILGGGWNVASPIPRINALGLLLEVPWAELGVEHSVEIALLDGNDAPVLDLDGQPIRIDGRFTAEKPPGVLLGKAATMPLALTIPPLTLQPSKDFKWRLSIDGHSKLEWEVGFSTPPSPHRLAS